MYPEKRRPGMKTDPFREPRSVEETQLLRKCTTQYRLIVLLSSDILAGYLNKDALCLKNNS